MLSKVLIFILLMLRPAHAEEGRFTIVSEGQPTPFEGVLFDIEATSHLLTIRQEAEMRCDLQMEYREDVLGTEFQLERDNFQAHLAAVESEYSLRVEQKDMEIEQLQRSLEKMSPRNEWVWFAGGTTVGVALTTGVVYVILNSMGEN